MSSPREPNFQISVAEKLKILIRYTAIKHGKSSETITNICREFGVSKNMPHKIFKEAEQGNITPKYRSGRPSKMTNPDIQKQMEKAIRKQRKSTTRQLAKIVGISKSNTTKCQYKSS